MLDGLSDIETRATITMCAAQMTGIYATARLCGVTWLISSQTRMKYQSVGDNAYVLHHNDTK